MISIEATSDILRAIEAQVMLKKDNEATNLLHVTIVRDGSQLKYYPAHKMTKASIKPEAELTRDQALQLITDELNLRYFS
jgi:hypothetical protein